MSFDFEQEYLRLIEDSFFVKGYKVRFVLSKINSIIKDINKEAKPYEYDEYCIEVRKDSELFARRFTEEMTIEEMEQIDWHENLFHDLIRKQVDKKVGENGFYDWWLENRAGVFKNYVDYFNEEFMPNNG